MLTKQIIQEPRWQRFLTRLSEICILVAAVIALWSVARPGPISLSLFMLVAQGCIAIGVTGYVVVAVIEFKRRHGVSRIYFAPGETIFRQGDPPDYIYTIISGEVEVVRDDQEHGEMVLSLLGPGQYFGEMAVINNTPRNATIRALTPVEAMSMQQADFTTLYMLLPDLQQNIEQVISTKLDAEAKTTAPSHHYS